MTKIYLVRHGQDQDNANGILNGQRNQPLTEIGKEQARVLAEKVKELDLHIDKVYSSPLDRAYFTAEAVTEALGLEKPEKLDLLIERDFGIMTGQPQSNILEMCSPDIIQAEVITYFLSPERAETFPQLVERSKKIFTWLEENAKYETILLTTHGDIGKMMYAAYYDEDWKDVLLKFHFGNSEVLLLDRDSKPEDRHVHKTDKQYNK